MYFQLISSPSLHIDVIDLKLTILIQRYMRPQSEAEYIKCGLKEVASS